MASDAVQQIKERVSIVDVVAPYVELHKAGKNMKGRSPFTEERTPSFFVSPERNMYYCFSTSQGGDIFTFVQTMEGVDFKGALKILAERAGVELIPEDPKKRTEREQLYAILEEAAKFFESHLNPDSKAYSYLTKRSVTDKTIKTWRIGYAHDEWRELKNHLEKKGFTVELITKAGLIKGVEGKDPYDVFRDRIMFPICDSAGKVVGFSGRLLGQNSDLPKYVNSPETDLFNKSEILFGYDKAKHGIRTLDFSLLVEGQFDVVLSHQAGYRNAVAVSGTALTSHHVALLQRLSHRVLLALDSDRAGLAAVKKAADIMLGRGMDVKVVKMPKGSDPADMIMESSDSFKQVIKEAKHVVEFLMAVIKDETTDERKLKLRVRDEVLPYILKIRSPLDREHFVKVVADELGVKIEAIHLELSSLESSDEGDRSVSSASIEAKVDDNVDRKQSLLSFLITAHDLVEKKVQNILEKALENICGQSVSELSAKVPAEEKSQSLFLLEDAFVDMDEKQVLMELASRLERLRKITLKEILQTKKEALRLCEEVGEDAKVQILLQEVKDIHGKLNAPEITGEDLQGL
ncbi:DNA primase [bacterium]|nr:DNA primase [bacterium]|tara:strand:- start:890 stop:2620 length:1731 start_codon:yes stop_codon:yes gene_type:complete